MSRHSADLPLEHLGTKRNASAINATATATVDQVATGYITSTSAAATTITLPTGTLLGARLNASAGFSFDLIVDNTAGANVVTMAVATNGIQATADLEITAATASVTPATITPLTIPSGVTGISCFRLMFSSPTAYAFSRVA